MGRPKPNDPRIKRGKWVDVYEEGKGWVWKYDPNAECFYDNVSIWDVKNIKWKLILMIAVCLFLSLGVGGGFIFAIIVFILFLLYWRHEYRKIKYFNDWTNHR